MKIKKNIWAASGKAKSSLVLKNAQLVNVLNQEIETVDIAIENDIIVGIGKYDGVEEIDCTGLYAAPGFIDSHVHIESSMVTPEIFSNITLKSGVTTIIADPHEIANVLGEDGINFMIDNASKAVSDIYFMMPSCVPAVNFEDSGAVLTSNELAKFADNERVLGLGEVMDVNAVLNAEKDMIQKILLFRSKNIDGHCPGAKDKLLNAYICSGIKTDHESSLPEEAAFKVKRGMYVMLREGSAAKNLKNLISAVNDKNYHRFLFCTDDRHIEALMEEGSINHCIKLAIQEGLDEIKAYIIASYNAALCYGLKDRGVIAPGYKADIVIFEDLMKLNIKNVIKSGKVFRDEANFEKGKVTNTVNLQHITSKIFKLEAKSEYVNAIKLKAYSLETDISRRKIEINSGFADISHQDDFLKIAVIERHKNTGKYSVGFLEGLGLKNCTIAQTIAHDSHNIIVVGDSDEDMAMAVNRVKEIMGGIVIVSNGKILMELSLPIGGLMASEKPDEVLSKVKALNKVAYAYGVRKEFDAFLTLGFMALPVIPEIKLTATGLYSYSKNKFIEIFC